MSETLQSIIIRGLREGDLVVMVPNIEPTQRARDHMMEQLRRLSDETGARFAIMPAGWKVISQEERLGGAAIEDSVADTGVVKAIRENGG